MQITLKTVQKYEMSNVTKKRKEFNKIKKQIVNKSSLIDRSGTISSSSSVVISVRKRKHLEYLYMRFRNITCVHGCCVRRSGTPLRRSVFKKIRVKTDLFFRLLSRLGGRSKTFLSSVNHNLPDQRHIIKRCFSEECRILGIETSCDDTGCAVLDNNGNILGQAIHSQQDIHIEHGGILPPLARDLHKDKIEVVVNEALEQSGVKLEELDAIAVTVKPGLSLSLLVGLEHAKQLACKANKPLIPIHHMEAHALTVRMEGKVTFPFLVLLMSGGHCLLSLVQSVDKFLTLGHTVDDAPGEALDKICRRLKLWNCKQWSGMSGGAAIENAAKSGDPLRFDIAEPLLHTRDCNFSFAGVKNSTRKAIIQEEIAHGIEGDEIIPHVEDLCASVQLAISKHLCRRLQRAMVYCMETKLITHPQPYLVLSGGVASNSFIRSAVELVASSLDWKVAAPPPSLCTDNGAMIAWNGVEWYLAGSNLVPPDKHHTVDIQPKCPLGENISDNVTAKSIKCSWVSLKPLYEKQI